MKNILMLGTGGTIASVPSADGLIPALDGAAMLRLVPELEGICTITCKEILNLDSSNLEPAHWQLIAEAVAADYANFDGFVITHGTDTMAYTAAALSQMLHNCQKPVILTGAQLPIQAEGSDAPANVYHAFLAATSALQGVALVFGDKVIHGAHAKKLYTENFNGFASINHEPLATISHNHLFWQKGALQGGGYGAGEFTVNTALEPKVAVVKLIPGTNPDILEIYEDMRTPEGEIDWDRVWREKSTDDVYKFGNDSELQDIGLKSSDASIGDSTIKNKGKKK